MNKKILSLFLLITILFFVSCMVTNRNFYINKEIFIPEGELVTINEFKIEANEDFNSDEVKKLFSDKFILELKNLPIKLTNEESKFSVSPCLFLKIYEENFIEKKYYKFYIEVKKGNKLFFEYTIDYNGDISIYDSKLQNELIKNFIKKFKKIIK